MVRRAPSKPPTLRRRAPENTKNSSLCWGGFLIFWTESGSLISVSKSITHSPCWGYLRSEKNAVLTYFSDDFLLVEINKCKLQHFCFLTSFAGAMRKRRKCCKYQYFLRLEMHKTLQIPVFLPAKQKKHCIPVVPHKAVAEVSKIGNL